nr:hypothetical protein [Tanacetum cinerariifolium]
AILSGAENRPSMLEKDMYDSWRSRMELYMLNRQQAEATQADCNVKAMNIILQALPLEIYALVSTHKVAKDLWERIQMLMQGKDKAANGYESNEKREFWFSRIERQEKVVVIRRGGSFLSRNENGG